MFISKAISFEISALYWYVYVGRQCCNAKSLSMFIYMTKLMFGLFVIFIIIFGYGLNIHRLFVLVSDLQRVYAKLPVTNHYTKFFLIFKRHPIIKCLYVPTICLFSKLFILCQPLCWAPLLYCDRILQNAI